MPSASESAANTQTDVNNSKELDKPLMNTKAGLAGNLTGNIAMAVLPAAAAAGLRVLPGPARLEKFPSAYARRLVADRLSQRNLAAVVGRQP